LKTFGRYLLFQLPGWALLGVFILILLDKTTVPVWATIGFFVLWIAKDLAVYPLVRHAYEKDSGTGSERMIGKKGVTQHRLAPEGYVKIDGELWKAQTGSSDQPIPQQRPVTVIGARGLVLIVQEER
jgi:membrane-bound ClpP family serine protease